MLMFRCYEPPSTVVEVTDQVLLRHVFVSGSTGSGKTSGVITPALQQLVAFAARNPHQRIGMLVLDGKGDGTAERVKEMARVVGRAADVKVLSMQGDTSYDLFGGFTRLDQLDDFARRFLAGSEDMGPQNQFWEVARAGFVASALALLLASSPRISFKDALRFMQDWWFCGDRKGIDDRLRFVGRVMESSHLSEASRQRLALAINDVKTWSSFDSRSLASHRASLLNAIRPLMSVHARSLFDSDKPNRFVPADALNGRILVASLNAQRHPELATLMMTLVKSDLFAAVQERGDIVPGEGRLVGLICDEYPLVAEPQDAEFLATARSRGAFVIASVQSLISLDHRMGRNRREALVSQFNSHFFFNSREPELDAMAHVIMGTRLIKSSRTQSSGNLLERPPGQIRIRKPICELGALAQLGAHRAYVRLVDGPSSEGPVWLEPKFYHFDRPKAKATIGEDGDLTRAVREVYLAGLSRESRTLREAAAFLSEMLQRGRRLWLSAPIVQGLVEICIPRISREEIVEDLMAIKSFEGLAEIPDCWLAGLRHLFQRQGVIATAVRGVGICDGMLILDLESGISVAERSSFLLHATTNLWVYPNLWRRARARDLNRLWAQSPHLRTYITGSSTFIVGNNPLP